MYVSNSGTVDKVDTPEEIGAEVPGVAWAGYGAAWIYTDGSGEPIS